MRSILIAEDDPHITSFVRRGLRAAGYETAEAADGHTALLMARSGTFDLVLLDIGLGGMDGFDVLANLRGEGVATPVIILTARDSVIDTVRGLESGANDYVTKPFQFAELIARVRLRIGDGEGRAAGPVLTHGDVRVDVRARTVTVDGDMRELTSRE
ncbi:response regulator transcription factor, partial [Microbacterium oxydans]|uniref:response regulator transcription factor n=1 Tax=Microbacterium oxydans TaxID=82380 RepID=UPI0024ACFD7A